ncbi:hypothetical protein ACHAW5_008859 [Stephanodiscus triporus]|uniref:Uncharacterized protein n=1 Tax=Stephanodiscus triporus TaxID=2934178 RepID=A0ABD3QXJ6_9STRA
MDLNFIFDSTIDYSFAIWAPKRKSRRNPPSCLRTAPACVVDPCNDGHGCGRSLEIISPSSSEDTSSRSVTFADDVVSEVRSFPRYERESVPSLFYNRLDLQRFKHEARLERMRVQVIW